MVLVAPGVYHETVVVTTPYVTIRGEDRNRTILDGEDQLPERDPRDRGRRRGRREPDGAPLRPERRSVDRASSATAASYLTAYNNGDYGIYAFDSRLGRFDHSYAGGSPDSGFYIGQCYPCHALITDVLAETQRLGYCGTNAGGDLAIVNSEWRDNLAGIVPNTLDSEAVPPQRDVLIAGQLRPRQQLDDARTRRTSAYPTYGIGILIAGGVENTITQNLVEDHDTYGIAILPNLDANFWVTRDNHVVNNVVVRSGRADLALGAPSVRR